MPIPIIETCRKRKRKPKFHNLQRFGEEGFPINRNGSFRDHIRVFLRDCAENEDYSIRGMPVWRTLLNHETKNLAIPLYTVEEDVIRSSEPYCDHCRCTGWSNHFVSKRKYHLIIPIDSEWNLPLEEDVFDLQTHLLHGLIHSNGFGHLICINGMEGGSKYLCGREIVDLWDRVCNSLGARMITVEDLSKKRSMELRLLYGVAYGHSWFGKWGYKFCRGSYGVTKIDYENAIELLGSLELDQIEFDFSEHQQAQEIKQVFRCYREMSEGHLKTFKDLLRFMLIIKSHAPQTSKLLPVTPLLLTDSPHQKRSNRLLLKKSDVADNEKPLKYRNYSSVAANLGSRWPVRRLEFAAEVIVESLKEMKAMKQKGMTRQDVRDSARLHIGDTGLLDYVLKSMNNVIVGNVLVRRYVDPVTRILHYTVEELADTTKAIEPKKEEAVVLEEITPLRSFTSLKAGADVYGDLLLLYTNVLLNYPDSELVSSATQAILDSKHFIKEWPLWDNNDKVLQFVCRINPSLIDLRSEQITELPPGELVTVPLQATVFDLKQAIEETFRDTYCILAKFEVSEIDEVKEDMSLIESCSALTVRGHEIHMESKLKFQGGCDTIAARELLADTTTTLVARELKSKILSHDFESVVAVGDNSATDGVYFDLLKAMSAFHLVERKLSSEQQTTEGLKRELDNEKSKTLFAHKTITSKDGDISRLEAILRERDQQILDLEARNVELARDKDLLQQEITVLKKRSACLKHELEFYSTGAAIIARWEAMRECLLEEHKRWELHDIDMQYQTVMRSQAQFKGMPPPVFEESLVKIAAREQAGSGHDTSELAAS